MKTCSICKEEKDLSEFMQRPSGNYRHQCEACRSTQTAAGRYGLTVGEVEAQRKTQNNRCAICGIHADGIPHKNFKHNPLVIDHCHETDEFRGLLCPTCNIGLGQFKDNPALLRMAAEYLDK